MDAALKYGINNRLSDLVTNFKITNVENIPVNKPLDYIGELNKTDVMF